MTTPSFALRELAEWLRDLPPGRLLTAGDLLQVIEDAAETAGSYEVEADEDMPEEVP